MTASFILLSVAMKSLPLGIAYMIWTGIGAVGAFVVGVAVLGEAATPLRLIAAALIVAGLVLMTLSRHSSPCTPAADRPLSRNSPMPPPLSPRPAHPPPVTGNSPTR